MSNVNTRSAGKPATLSNQYITITMFQWRKCEWIPRTRYRQQRLLVADRFYSAWLDSQSAKHDAQSLEPAQFLHDPTTD